MKLLFVLSLLFSVQAWAADCGTTGTISERIADCKRIFKKTTRVFEVPRLFQEPVVYRWTMVSNIHGYITWRDETPNEKGKKLIWRDSEALRGYYDFPDAFRLCEIESQKSGIPFHLATSEEFCSSREHHFEELISIPDSEYVAWREPWVSSEDNMPKTCACRRMDGVPAQGYEYHAVHCVAAQ